MGGGSKFFMLLSTPASSNIRFLSPFFSSSRPLPFGVARFHSRVSLASISLVKNRHFSTKPYPNRLGFSVKVSEQLHTHTSRDDHGEFLGVSQNSRVSHPWPEWVKLVDHLRASGYFDREVLRAVQEDDVLSGFENLSEEFVRAAKACLTFARDRWDLLRSLSRKDIEIVVANGSPFLFQNAIYSARRMREFLVNDGDVLEIDRAHTVDMMRFLLSYASNPVSALDQNNLQNRGFIEASVRNLLNELVDVSGTVRESNVPETLPSQFPGRYGQSQPSPSGKNIEMKRGDWICPKCSFMNFARNMKCLECNEVRPKRVLTGGEWECPQCDFFNYGRNTVCLRCDCKHPGEAISASAPNVGLGYNQRPNFEQAYDGRNSSKSEIESKLSINDKKAERWFNKVSQLKDVSDLSSAIADEDFPEIMPLRKGVNRFVVSTRKTPLERRLANAQYRRNLGNGGSAEGSDFPAGNMGGMGSDRTPETSISQTLDKILGSSETNECMAEKNNDETPAREKIDGNDSTNRKHDPSENWFSTVSKLHDVKDLASAIPDDEFPEIMPMRKGENRFVVSKRKTPAERRLTSPQYRRSLTNQVSESDYVPFTPLPPDMFDKSKNLTGENDSSATAKTGELVGSVSVNSESSTASASELSETQENQTEKNDSEPSDPSERWFKKVAELDDVTDIASAISDEDFPEIMPMRKGENRFVISKKKDRSLTSPQYKRRVAMEQTNSSNFVPFVPFPPDYFAKKDKQPACETSSQNAPAETSSVPAIPEKLSGSPENGEASKVDAGYGGVAGNTIQQENLQNNSKAWSRDFPARSLEGSKASAVYGVADGNSTQRPEFLQDNRESWNMGFSGRNLEESKGGAVAGNPNQQPENVQNNRVNWNRGFTGKSLEGSAVKEPDPLDMSEEAKVERWFRRVAQINDISELSKIPDEDFPEIMPMRKGVNRFVVSKRKTPLERRLTSPQYRRNLPIVSSDPENDAR